MRTRHRLVQSKNLIEKKGYRKRGLTGLEEGDESEISDVGTLVAEESVSFAFLS